jgi:dUTP pyrophosphatase|tara:strand:- start:9541 stop:9981 length:441 start_codon:yes stop_codon:yes gene_type:complete
MKNIKMSKVREVKTPTRGTPGSAGLDFYVPDGISASVPPSGDVCIPSGIRVDVPKGHAFIAHNKSGIALNKKLSVGACVVDEDYQGEIHLHLVNMGEDTVHLEGGEKIVQFVLLPVKYPLVKIVPDKELFYSTTTRGDGGFGSTGA